MKIQMRVVVVVYVWRNYFLLYLPQLKTKQMALTAEQKELGTAIAELAGTTIHIIPGTQDANEWLEFISAELKTVAETQSSGNPVKDEVESVLKVLIKVVPVLPDGTKGKKQLNGAVTILTGVAHMFGL